MCVCVCVSMREFVCVSVCVCLSLHVRVCMVVCLFVPECLYVSV